MSATPMRAELWFTFVSEGDDDKFERLCEAAASLDFIVSLEGGSCSAMDEADVIEGSPLADALAEAREVSA